MNLGVVTTSYPRTPHDFAGNFVAAHVETLRALGHHVDVIAGGPGPAAPGLVRIASPLFSAGGAPDLLERHPVRTAGAAAVFSARLTAAVLARARCWDSIIAHWLVPSALAALPARVPLLAIAHGGDVHTLRRLHLLAPALHLLAQRDAELVFVSEELRAIAIAAAPRLTGWLARARIQPMGLELARFAAIPRAPTTPPTIVVAARLVPLKGIDVAIEAFARLGTTARLVIAGDGPARATLEAQAAGVRGVELLGAVDLRHRDRLLGSASVVVVPSRVTPSGRTEGTPLIALEALAAGVPVVASSVGGLRALAPAARLVRPEDPEALAAELARALASPPPPTELKAAVAHLDWRHIAPRLVRSR